MNKIPEGFKSIDYKNIKKDFYYINKEGVIINKFGKELSTNSGGLSVTCNDGGQSSYRLNRILNHCFGTPLPKRKSNKKVYRKQLVDIPEGYKVINYKDVRKDFYYMNEDSKIINKYGTEMTIINGKVSLMCINEKHNIYSISINKLYEHVFGKSRHTIGYKLIDKSEIKQNHYYYKRENGKYIIKSSLGKIVKIYNNTVNLCCENGCHKTFTLDYIFGTDTFKQNGYKLIDYKDVKEDFYYINKEGNILNKNGRPVKIKKYGKVNLLKDTGKTGSFIIYQLLKHQFNIILEKGSFNNCGECIIPEEFKVIDYKNIKKDYYYINKEGVVINKYGMHILPNRYSKLGIRLSISSYEQVTLDIQTLISNTFK